MNIRAINIIVFSFFLVMTGCSKAQSTPTPELIGPPEIQLAEVTIYFQDESRFAAGTEPYEIGVVRRFNPDAFIPRVALQAYFDGPTDEEYDQGLRAVLSGCTGFSEFSIQDGVAMVKLEGPCTSGGSTYTIAQPIIKTLLQFPEIRFVKIFDSAGNTEEPFGPSNSIPFVLEP
jgi:Fe-S cluster biogenesis protein NfuA